ncbi:hypothetical protein ACOMHN_035689 [Nucella lapillus]
MVLWRHRHLGYKIGFFGLIFSSLVYVIAFALPYWGVLRLRQYGMLDQTVGLWQYCVMPSTTCVSNVHSSNPPWINAARATCSIALILFVMMLWCGYYRNFSRTGQERCVSPGRHIEGLSLIACLLGSAGSLIFAFQFHVHYVHRKNMGHLYWAFPLLCCSLGLAGISSSLMLLFNRQRYYAHSRTTTRMHRGPQGVPVAIQFSSGGNDDFLNIPYFGEISREELVMGAGPMQPPAYEVVTAGGVGVGVGYSAPPIDVSDAPPLYEDIAKDCVPLPQVSADHEGQGDKECWGSQGSGAQ